MTKSTAEFGKELTAKEWAALEAIASNDARVTFNRYTISEGSELSEHAAAGVMATMDRKNVISKISKDVWKVTENGMRLVKGAFGTKRGKPKAQLNGNPKKAPKKIKKVEKKASLKKFESDEKDGV
jgi:hypothetical protein